MDSISCLSEIVLRPVSLLINAQLPSTQNSLHPENPPSQAVATATAVLGLALPIIYSLIQYYYSKGQPDFMIPKNEDGSDWSPEDQLQWIKNQIKHPILLNPIACVNAVYHNKISRSTNDVTAIVTLIRNGSLQAFQQTVTLADSKQAEKWIKVYIKGVFTKKVLMHKEVVLITEQNHEFKFRNINRSLQANAIRKCLRDIETQNIFFN